MTTSLDVWNELMSKYDLYYYKQFQSISDRSLNQIQESWKSIRRNALHKLNKELNDSGKMGQLLNIDVSDDALYSYVDNENKSKFFRYSRILDFNMGFLPKNFVLIRL